MFFGLTKLGYKQLRDPRSIQQITTYINDALNKYTILKASSNKDPYHDIAKASLEELRRELLSASYI